ncbi:MAG TPA: HEAT repeat domain-containing protein, partial [Planctomycetota bacterium]|nr:HEAT repeat domain-containing protein [Planctomycetota bacterium]
VGRSAHSVRLQVSPCCGQQDAVSLADEVPEVTHIRRCLIALLLAAASPAQDGLTSWIDELLRNKDDADIKLVEKIAMTRTRQAAEGLVKAYDVAASLMLRREIMRGLSQFAGVADAEQPAFTKIANIATQAEEDDLRLASLQALGLSPLIGKSLLKKIVDSEAPDSVREPAMREHVKLATAADTAWYRHVWNLKQEQRKDDKGNIAANELNAIRLLAFSGAAPFLSEEEICEALRREVDPKIRRYALNWMRKQSMPKTAEMAQWMLERVDFPGADRSEAARILIDRQGAKAVNTFLELAKKPDAQTPADLRVEMARLIVALDDDATNKKLSRMIGKGKPHEKVFALLATAKVNDPKVIATIRKGLEDEELEVRRATGQALGNRGDRESLPDLRAMLAHKKQPGDQRIAIEAISAIERNSSAWTNELVGFCTSEERDVRNTAVELLGKTRDKRRVPVLLQALEHDDWSTRFVAIDALAEMRDKQSVPKLIERLGKEQGRMRKHIAEVLWQLTAQAFEEDLGKWTAWWAESGEKFAVATEKDLDKAEAERERRRLMERTRAGGAKFFGIKVESHRVIFIIDISGSMLESMYGRFVGKRGAARIDVAKQELIAAINSLEEGALFNVLAFSSSVARWQEQGIGVNTAQSRAEAIEWIDRLGARGATNLYDSVKMAFEDKDVDTIFIMSDGEPTNGEVIDPHTIREDVAFWNKHRKVKINCISIGGNLEILEWLALDAGGKYVQMR